MAVRKKKKQDNETIGGSGGGWEVVYSGFVLILLCFFIMLCSFSSMETSKVTQFVKSFSLAVSIFTGGLNFDKGEIMLPVSGDIVEAQSELANIFEEIKEIMEGYGVEGDVAVFDMDGGYVIRLSDKILFDLGKADINMKAMPVMDKIGQILSKTTHHIRIEGHTDDIPINTAMFPSNWELSATRAINVLRYFNHNHKISANRLSAEGFGEYHPLVSNNSSENRSKNRRVEIKIFDMVDENQDAGLQYEK